MKNFNLLFFLLLVMATHLANAQNRYIEEVFNNHVVTSNVVYGVNASVLELQVVGQAIPRQLMMDVYEPEGDPEVERPLVLVFHTGNFLPFPTNGGTGGLRTDSTVIETCRRLARRGFVAAAVSYRLGWNPLGATQDVRVFTLINAAYRGVQDARTCIRYFKLLAKDQGNPFGVDTTRIALWGIGTGGYITAATATLDRYSKVLLPKFTTVLGGQPFPMVVEAINGDIYGTSVGITPAGYPGFPAGDTLCYPNHVTYADGSRIGSDFQMTLNLGGALGDSSWIDPGQAPWVSFHVEDDPFAPYRQGIVVVPGLNLPVVEVQGSYIIQQLQNQYGNNDIFKAVTWLDDFTPVANTRNDGLEGLFPFRDESSSPWDFWADDNVNKPATPTTAEARARSALYLDTIFNYFAPRACLTLNLGCNLEGILSSRRTLLPGVQVGLTIAPNPSIDQMFLQTELEHPMIDIHLYDMNGRLVRSHANVRNNTFILDKGNLPPGVYVARIRFEQGILAQRVVFR
jgi:hypothetical protein